MQGAAHGVQCTSECGTKLCVLCIQAIPVVHKWTLFEAERQKEDSMQHVCKDMLHTRIPYTNTCIPCQLAYTWEIPLKARDQEIPIARTTGLSTVMGRAHLSNHMLCNGAPRG